MYIVKNINEYGIYEGKIKEKYNINDIIKEVGFIEGDRIEVIKDGTVIQTIEFLEDNTNYYIEIDGYNFFFIKVKIDDKIVYYRKNENDITKYKKVTKKEFNSKKYRIY